MLETLWTVAAAGLLALCMTGCGGDSDSDYASKICNKMKACVATTDVAACETHADQVLSAEPATDRSDTYKVIDYCVGQECTFAVTCISSAGLSPCEGVIYNCNGTLTCGPCP